MLLPGSFKVTSEGGKTQLGNLGCIRTGLSSHN